MGLACPACGDPQADATHLANHLAFTAMLRGGEHEAWLDEHAPGWAELDEETLADRVAALAADTEFPQVFEDTTGGDHDHERERRDPHRDGAERGGDRPGVTDPDTLPGATAPFADADDEVAEEILAEARELTRKRRESDDETQAE